MKPQPTSADRTWPFLLVGVVFMLAFIVAIAFIRKPFTFESRLERLIRQLQNDQNPEVRAAAARELGSMGDAARPAAPALVAALRDEGRYVTQIAIIFPQEHYVANEAYAALKQIRGPETVDALADAMVASSMKVKQGAASWHWAYDSRPGQLLAELGPESVPAAERVLVAIDGCNQGEVVKQGVLALLAMNLAPDSPAATKAQQVLPQFCRWGPETGRAAALVLHRLAPADDEVNKLYVQAMLSGEPYLAPGSVEINARTIPHMIAMLAYPANNEGAIRHLSSGDFAEVATPVIAALQAKDPNIRAGAALVLARRGAEAATASGDLAPLLDDDRLPVRVAAAIALWQVDYQVTQTLPILAGAAMSEEASAREMANQFLQQRGPADAWGAAEIVKLAAADHPLPLRLAALEILAKLGPAARDQQPPLLELLRDTDPAIQRAAAKAVAALEKK